MITKKFLTQFLVSKKAHVVSVDSEIRDDTVGFMVIIEGDEKSVEALIALVIELSITNIDNKKNSLTLFPFEKENGHVIFMFNLNPEESS